MYCIAFGCHFFHQNYFFFTKKTAAKWKIKKLSTGKNVFLQYIVTKQCIRKTCSCQQLNAICFIKINHKWLQKDSNHIQLLSQCKKIIKCCRRLINYCLFLLLVLLLIDAHFIDFKNHCRYRDQNFADPFGWNDR